MKHINFLFAFVLTLVLTVAISTGAFATEKTRTAFQTEIATYKLQQFNAGSLFDRLTNLSDSAVFKQDGASALCYDVHPAEDTDVAAATDVYTFRMPYAFTITEVRVSVVTAGTTDTIGIDLHEGGTTIFSTGITLDATELTSTTAATPAVISDSSLATDALMSFDVDSADTGNTGQGLKACLIGYKT